MAGRARRFPLAQQMAGEREPDPHRRGLRVAGVLLIVAGLVMASLARLGWLGSSTRSSARASVARPTAFGLSGVPSLRASVGGVHDGLTTIRVKITAPRGAVDMAISDDPTFGSAAWQPVASYTDVLVASAGYVEIFGRFRAKDASDFVPAITGVTVPSVADRANVAKNGVTALGMVDPTVIAVSITTPRASGAAKTAVLDGSTWDDPRTLNLTSTDDPSYRDGQAATALVQRASGPRLKNAWGGHMDGGDWDRRIQHLWYLRAGLDLVDLFPETFGALNLDLPESGNTIPDVVDEGLWSLDLYMRLQDRDGGIRGGIEADASPPKGQTSWTTKQRLFAYAADPWSSYLFAGAAAEAAFSLRASDPKRSASYLSAAQRAADWAGRKPIVPASVGEIDGQRLVAAAALYRATGDKKWHDEFLRGNPLVKGPVEQIECPRHELCDAAWIYLRTAGRRRNDVVVANAAASFRRTADSLLAAADTSLYRFSMDDPNVPLVWGLGPSTPKTMVLIRAYVLFGDQKYWAQAARAGGYALGANPLNMSFVTGLGQNKSEASTGGRPA